MRELFVASPTARSSSRALWPERACRSILVETVSPTSAALARLDLPPFLRVATLKILVLGILAFALDTAAGILFAKAPNAASRGHFNPLLGAAGISAFPMAARVVNRGGLEEDFENFLLMHAMGANTAGQVASVVAGGVLLALLGAG
jgi:Na+-transporting methylmalonyl-CoA/oxaloacetate decarboxylase beta subunit